MSLLTAIFDIGKTNKKLLLFDREGNIVYELSECLPETKDEDGFPTEDVSLLKEWIFQKWEKISNNKEYLIDGLNFTSYGASFVHLNEAGAACFPLYNYLKPYPKDLLSEFYHWYGGLENFSQETASPQMGMLNSGLQIYWLKYRKRDGFNKIKCSLHLPQYLSFLFSGQKVTEFTSVGCHTALWDFKEENYHQWVYNEDIIKLFPAYATSPIVGVVNNEGNKEISIGTGLHDSSSAIIPYLQKFGNPFLLLSTGTWCIVLNPFDDSPLTKEDLSKDCLNFLRPDGKSIKAARIFLGKEHDYQVERIAQYFNKDKNYYTQVKFEDSIIHHLFERFINRSGYFKLNPSCMEGTGPVVSQANSLWDLSVFSSFEEAYHQLILDLTSMLKISILLADKGDAKQIFVDGGFSRSSIFMKMLATHFPGKNIFSSEINQATALGACLHINPDINFKMNIIQSEPSQFALFFQEYFNACYTQSASLICPINKI